MCFEVLGCPGTPHVMKISKNMKTNMGLSYFLKMLGKRSHKYEKGDKKCGPGAGQGGPRGPKRGTSYSGRSAGCLIFDPGTSLRIKNP